MNVNREDSIDVGRRTTSSRFFGAMQQATREAIAKYTPTRS